MDEASVATKDAARVARREATRERRAAQTNPATASWYRSNPTKEKAAAKARYAAKKDEIKAYAAAYREANADRIRVARAEYRAKNRAKVLAGKAAWRRANREAHRIYDHNRRSRERAIGGKLSVDRAVRLFQLQKGKCACCDRPLGRRFHVDHIVALSNGGLNIDSNTQLLRAECNLRKGTLDPIEFMRRKGRLL